MLTTEKASFLTHLVHCSIQVHCANNLLRSEGSETRWLSAQGSEERITCALQLEQPSAISSIDLGNDGSAFVELHVCQSSTSDEWTVLLPRASLMAPKDSQSNTNRTLTKSFRSDALNSECLNKPWDRVKIICEQKFNGSKQFGLAFIKMYCSDPSTTQVMKDVRFVLSGFQNPLRIRTAYESHRDGRCVPRRLG